jgi:uncharacterized membrane protein YhiD involved in acid resistance
MKLSIFLSLIVLIKFVSFDVMAQPMNNKEACTTPRNADLSETDQDERWVYCDIYSRQFAHRNRIKDLQNSLQARAENFKASSQFARERHQEALQDYWNSMESQ